MKKLLVNLVWHMHQPYYFCQEEDVFVLPWVRTHATKDYLFMGKLVERFPQVKVTFNFVPSLLRQLQLYMEGKEDKVMILAKKKASFLTEGEKQDILRQFFWVSSPHVYADFPRYRELYEKFLVGWSHFEEQDFLDLQVLYQLIWFDPLIRREEAALRVLQEKGRNYQEEDKEIIWEVTQRVFAAIFAQYRKLLEAQQIEISFSPFYHPILPLLVDSDIARVAHPGVSLPPNGFAFSQDALFQIQKGKKFSEEVWEKEMRGMWPSEGSVSEAALELISREKISWVATDEEILRKSLGRDPQDWLYLPHRYQEVVIFFRDRVISDAIGFEYHRLSTGEAIENFVGNIQNLKKKLWSTKQEKPYVVSIILDGENAWEYYVENGLPFLSELYQFLSQDPEISTVTPSGYLDEYGRFLSGLSFVAPGSWIFGNFDTWIGHEEKNRAWEELVNIRKQFEAVRDLLPLKVREEIEELFYQAEGSDWFWWLGEDHPSPQKGIFWNQFSSFLARIKRLLEKRTSL
ncbi:MAG: glycoside hydrolase family 57 protein [Candidatus Caldatribacteriaceae bacterium]